MREKLSRRLEHLEMVHAAAVRAKEAAAAPRINVCEMLREHLKAHGFVQTGNESLAETMARAFGMNSQELEPRTAIRATRKGNDAVACLQSMADRDSRFRRQSARRTNHRMVARGSRPNPIGTLPRV
jgi:hypothetical protein